MNPSHKVLSFAKDVRQSGSASLIDVESRELLYVFETGEVGGPKAVAAKPGSNSRSAIATKTGGYGRV